MDCRLYSEDSDDSVDLGRNWEAMTFLFSGSAKPKGLPETLLVEEWPDMGGGEASMIDAQSIAAFANWLESVSDQSLIAKYDPSTMVAQGIYRAHVIEQDPDYVAAEIAEQLPRLREFSNRRRTEGTGAIIVIC